MPDRVLVTGATGFVGSHIAQVFVEAGYQVRCGVRASSNTGWLGDLAVELTPLDLTHPKDLPRAVEDVDVIVHAAGVTRAKRTGDYQQINARGTQKLAAASAKAGVRRFVLISSLAARGPDALTKDGHDRPASSYGRSKLEAETHLRSLSEQIETVVLRPAAIYGPRDIDLLPLFKMANSGWLLLPSHPGLLQPVYVADVAQAALAAARKTAGFGPFPIAEADRYAWHEVAGGLRRALGRPVRTIRLPAAVFELAGRTAEWAAKLRGSAPIFDERRAEDLAVYTWTCEPSGAEQALGWRTEVSLFEGLKRTVGWYRQAGWL